MVVYLHKYYDKEDLLMQVFFPHTTPLDMSEEFEIERVEVNPKIIKLCMENTYEVWFEYKGIEHVVVCEENYLKSQGLI